MRKTLNHSRGWGKMWRLVAAFVLSGYAVSTVLAFDVNSANSTSYQQPIDSTSLHTQIESDVALWVKKVWNNLVAYMQDGIPSNQSNSSNSNQTTSNLSNQKNTNNEIKQPLIRINFPESESTLLPVFEDIQNDAQKQNIELLASIGLFQGDGQGKFHPNNHVRCSDFVRVIVDLYRYQLGYSLDSDAWLTNKKLLDLKQPNTLLWKKLNTAKELWLLEWVDFIVRDQAITPLQVKKIINNALALHLSFGQSEKLEMIDTTKSVVTKSEMAKYLVEIFQMKFPQNNDVFSDISNHKDRSAITILAQLGVVAGRNGKFYPDNETHRSDGIIMIANSLLAKERKALVINDFYHLNTINDVTYFATYAPHLEYLLEHEIGTSLLNTTQSGSTFLPDAVLTMWEAYTLVAEAAGIKILNPDSWAATKPITRGDLANLLVEAFEFNTQSVNESNNKETNSVQVATANTEEISTEKKSLLVSILKDVINEL